MCWMLTVRTTDGSTPARPTAPSSATVDWSDRDPLPWSLSISQSVSYHEASDEGSGVRNTVRATLVDQYGDPVSGAKVRFWSEGDNTPNPMRTSTRSLGTTSGRYRQVRVDRH